MKKLPLFLALTVLLAISSCNHFRIDKRHYNNGFYVDFGHSKKQAASSEDVTVDGVGSAENTAAVASEKPELESQKVIVPQMTGVETIANPVDTPTPFTESTPVSATEIQNEDATTHENKKIAKEQQPSLPADAPLWALVLLAFFIPPLAVFLKQGITQWFWIDLILAILGFGFRWSSYIGGFFLAAVVIAFLVVFDVI